MVPSGLGLRLVLQVVASQVLEVVASHMATNVVVVVLVVVVVFVLVLQDLLVLLALLLEIRPGHCLRVVLGAVVGQISMMLLCQLLVLVVLHRGNLLVHCRNWFGHILLGVHRLDCLGSCCRLLAQALILPESMRDEVLVLPHILR